MDKWQSLDRMTRTLNTRPLGSFIQEREQRPRPAVVLVFDKNVALGPGVFLESSNGRYRLDMQRDGNLVLYQQIDGSSVWSTRTQGHRNLILLFFSCF